MTRTQRVITWIIGWVNIMIFVRELRGFSVPARLGLVIGMCLIMDVLFWEKLW